MFLFLKAKNVLQEKMAHEEINHIEETLAHQEQQILDLSEMLIRQGAEIEALKKQIRRMQDKIGIIEDSAAPEGTSLSAAEQAARDKPPHY